MSRFRTVSACAVLLSAIGVKSFAADQPTGNSPPPPPSNRGPDALPQSMQPSLPPYKTERWDEDYSYLARPQAKSDFFDPIKYIPLGSDANWYLTLGGLVRDRMEYFNHNLFDTGPQTEHPYNLFRASLYADVHMSQYVRVFVEGRTALENGREGGARTPDLDTLDPQQAFADVMLPIGDDWKVTVRGGRQELLYGAERLIGPADWLNVRRTFDGVRVMVNSPGNQLDFFLTRPTVIEKYDFDNANNAVVFGGIYDTLQLPNLMPNAHTQLEMYGLYLKNRMASFPSDPGAGYEIRYTVGSRFISQPKPFDMDIEADYQFGTFKGEDIQAWSVASELGYNFDQVAFTPRPFIGFDIASGDRSSGGNLETFNQLFPSAHPFFGYIDAIGRQNIIDLHGGAEATLLKNVQWAQKVSVRGEYHQFWRESDNDAVYQANGAVLRPGGATGSRNIGSEADILLRWQIDRHLSTYFGYSHFFHGTFIQDTGAHKDIDFAYAAVTFTF
jgi:hypothetical protein